MIAQDKKQEFDMYVGLSEYLASFWNKEAVEKIREARKSREMHSFASDEEFEEQILSESYKNNPLVKALQKLRASDANYDDLNREAKDKKMRGPIDFSRLSSIIED